MNLPRVIEIVERYSTRPVTADAAIYHDLLIYGDDATDLLTDIINEFSASFEGFEFKTYFADEANWMPKLSRPNHQRLTVRQLAAFAASGKHWRTFAAETGIE